MGEIASSFASCCCVSWVAGVLAVANPVHLQPEKIFRTADWGMCLASHLIFATNTLSKVQLGMCCAKASL
jgi:hypothetical protein